MKIFYSSITTLIVLALACPWPVLARHAHGVRTAAPLTFTMQDLGALGAISEGNFVNDNGDVTAGTPFVTGAKVLGVIGELDKGKKVRIFKKKRRKQYRRTKGHRSLFTRVRITDIQI